MLLLAFGLGGIALPALHHLDHLDEIGSLAELSDEVALETASKGAADLCELCCVRLIGLSPAGVDAPSALHASVADPLAPDAPLLSATRPHDGRAPPVSA